MNDRDTNLLKEQYSKLFKEQEEFEEPLEPDTEKVSPDGDPYSYGEKVDRIINGTNELPSIVDWSNLEIGELVAAILDQKGASISKQEQVKEYVLEILFELDGVDQSVTEESTEKDNDDGVEGKRVDVPSFEMYGRIVTTTDIPVTGGTEEGYIVELDDGRTFPFKKEEVKIKK